MSMTWFFATPDKSALASVKAELASVKAEMQRRHTCTDLGELRHYLGLQITKDRADRTITQTQLHMVQHVLEQFGLQLSSTQPTSLAVDHKLTAPPSDESFEPSGPYAVLVGCLMVAEAGVGGVRAGVQPARAVHWLARTGAQLARVACGLGTRLAWLALWLEHVWRTASAAGWHGLVRWLVGAGAAGARLVAKHMPVSPVLPVSSRVVPMPPVPAARVLPAPCTPHPVSPVPPVPPVLPVPVARGCRLSLPVLVARSCRPMSFRAARAAHSHVIHAAHSRCPSFSFPCCPFPYYTCSRVLPIGARPVPVLPCSARHARVFPVPVLLPVSCPCSRVLPVVTRALPVVCLV
ncbi:unnamed protein product [Closterium sp. NIES-53]